MTARRVLVTGSSRGIGAAIALRLARDGFHVVVHYRSQADKAGAVVSRIEAAGGAAGLLHFDVGDRAGTRAAIESDIDENGAYYGLVCNAGITRDAPFPGMTDNDWDAVIQTGLGGFYNVVRPAVLPMVQARQGGRIVTLASISAITGNRGQVNYSAAKGAIISATKSLAVELAKRHITVNCVAPGLIDTDMTSGFDPDRLRDLVPAGRMGTPAEVAAVVAFLCSDEAAYVSRQVVSVNGGMVG